MKRTPIRRRGKKGETYEHEYLVASLKVAERSGGLCEIQATHNCSGAATLYPHHRKMRSQGGSNSLDNLLDVCWKGHDWIHRMPRLQAYEYQLIVPRDQPELPYKP